MSKFPTPDIEEPRYPTKYYRGYYLIRDPQEWSEKGRTVPIRRMPAHMRSRDPEEDFYRVRRWRPRSKTFYMFHPTLTYPFLMKPRTRWMEWGHWF